MLSNTLAKSVVAKQFFEDYQWTEIPNAETDYNKETKTLSWKPHENASIYKISIYSPKFSKEPSTSSEIIYYTHLIDTEIDLPSDGSTYKVRHNELLVAIEANVSTEILIGETGTLDLRKHPNPPEIGTITDVLIHQVFAVSTHSISNAVAMPLETNMDLQNIGSDNKLSVITENNLLRIQTGDSVKLGKYYFKCILQYKAKESPWTVPCSVILEVNVSETNIKAIE